MKPYQINKAAEQFGISYISAARMRTRYLLNELSQWEAYVDSHSDTLPLITAADALDEIIDMRAYEKRLTMPMKNPITDEMIASARAYPIDQLMEFRRGAALCPVHSEKTPSFRYNKTKNTAHCFGCGINMDSIDIVMMQSGCSFVAAVRQLA